MAFRRSSEAILEDRKSLDTVSDRHRAHIYSLQTQLGTWLVLGNGLALFTLAQAALARRVATDAWFIVACERFFIGLALAFLAMVASYFFALIGLRMIIELGKHLLTQADAAQRLASSQDEKERDEISRAQMEAERGERDVRQRAPQMQLLTGLNIVAYTLSGLLFLWGVSVCVRLTIL